MFELHAVMAEDARRLSQNPTAVMEILLVNVYAYFLFNYLCLNKTKLVRSGQRRT